jgi:hypothetical protein
VAELEVTVVARSAPWAQDFKRLQLVGWLFTRSMERGDVIVAYMHGYPKRPWYVRLARRYFG